MELALNLAGFAKKSIKIVTNYNVFFLDRREHPIFPLVLIHDEDMLSHVEAVQKMLD